jgi:hypothetical protein
MARRSHEFEVNKERAAIVKRIFEEASRGAGNYLIAKRLNKDGILPFGKAKMKRNGNPIPAKRNTADIRFPCMAARQTALRATYTSLALLWQISGVTGDFGFPNQVCSDS